ncbi:MAG TPA: GWxTD domain-containing protein [Vicinamibacteria bacterium]|jgi:GWxTD domain-containing protein
MRTRYLTGAFFLLAAAAPAADKLDKDSKKWLDEVGPIMLPQEERIFRDLKKEDRAEFQKIFWARRDPSPETPENEFQAEYQKARAEADRRFSVPGRTGSTTDCGRLFILLGEPASIKRQPSEGSTSPGGRDPEVWTYRDRPRVTFSGGEAQFAFDADCQMPQGARSGEQLVRLAETRVTQPQLDYRLEAGRLVKLEDLHKQGAMQGGGKLDAGAAALLKAPRQDFPLASQANYLKTQEGSTVVLGLARADNPAVTVEETAGRKRAPVIVVAQATDESGRVVAVTQQESTPEIAADGSLVVSYRLVLPPGKYTVHAGILDPKTQKASLTSSTLDVPNLDRGELSIAPLLMVEHVDPVETPDPKDAYAAFALGKSRIVPHFGTVLAATDSPSFFYQFYDPKVDDATGKRSAIAKLTILKDGKPVASAADDPFDQPFGTNVVGPVPLAKFGPGKYVAQLKVRDTVAGKDYVQELTFEVK